MLKQTAIAILLALGMIVPPAAFSKAADTSVAQPTTVPGQLVLGTAVKLLFNETIKTGKIKKGDPIHFVVMEDVKDPQGNILIKSQTPAVGTITRSTKARAFGKPGKLVFEFTATTAADGQTVLLRGKEEQRGKHRSLTAHGGNVTLEPGATYTAFVASPVKVAVNSSGSTSGNNAP
jgi:hypothetical protein